VPRVLVKPLGICTSRTVNSERVRYVFFAFTAMRHTSWQSLAQDAPCNETRVIAVIKFFGDHNLSLLREDYTTVFDPQHNFEAYPGQWQDFDNVSVLRKEGPL
jgi:hypothetical protein